jgi:hypothetical protein
MTKGKILRVKQGYNPNSSSIGSIIFSMSAAVIPASIVFGMVAGAVSNAVLQRVGRDAPGKTKKNATSDSK